MEAGVYMDMSTLTGTIIGLATEVHRELGPGLLESAYEECLCYELTRKKISFERNKPVALSYKYQKLNAGFSVDLLVDKRVVVELESVDRLMPLHDAQLLTYMKLGGWRSGLLMNFNVPVLKQGIRQRELVFPD